MRFKGNALKFMVHDGHLFRRASKNVPLRRVVDDEGDRGRILKALHEDCGHQGREGTYRRDIAGYCRSCAACQLRAPNREDEALHPT
jgi:hypothetical protein